MLEQLLGGTKEGIISDLSSKLGIDPGRANGFLQKALSMLEGGLTGGKFGASSLLSGDTSGIMSKLDMGQLAGEVGGDTGKARTGMETILGHLPGALKSSGGAGQLVSTFGAGSQGGNRGGSQGGIMGQAAGMAGKLFGKR